MVNAPSAPERIAQDESVSGYAVTDKIEAFAAPVEPPKPQSQPLPERLPAEARPAPSLAPSAVLKRSLTRTRDARSELRANWHGEIVDADFREREKSEEESKGQPILSPSLDDFAERMDQKFIRVTDHPLSTFSVDVDTASYAVIRRFLNEGRLPPPDAVRVEELINYFPYAYAPPADETPFAAHLEAAPAPWNPENTLVRIAIKGREIAPASRPALNLVYLIDVSGSMSPENKLPLVQRALQLLARQLGERDRIAMVVYAGSSGLVLPATSGARTTEIIEALDRLEAGGSTAGGSGIQLAYRVARENFDRNAVNRVILCTDGDFNVGLTQRGDLERLIEEEAKSGVFLTVLGFGMGNYKDSTLELLSNRGNGNYAYIDDFNEARKALVDQMMGTLVTIAKDVKIQVEFNPAQVAGYRLIGYENRLLQKEDFNNDQVDAGDIGAGHTVTAFYELIAAGRPVGDAPAVDPLKYSPPEIILPAAQEMPYATRPELLTVKLRYKQPDGDTSRKLEFPLAADAVVKGDPSPDFRFAAAVAAFGQRLRGSPHIRDYSYDRILSLAGPAVGTDPFGYRAEFLKLVRAAQALGPAPAPARE
ncbi:MAG: von Willebrand factor type A domain-containing protein [Kiritimatiellae bacterium]|nr:von Willebrand factor type A domain-containing protein [Kiritimatiellia bacterium]